jgi:hypothetical protein
MEKEDILQQTIRNESFHENSNDNGVTAVTLPHQKSSC